MSLNGYLIGNSVVMIGSCALVDPLTEAETPTDFATATFIRVLEDGTTLTYTTGDPEVTTLTTGIVACTVPLQHSGKEKWRFTSEDGCDCAAEDEIKVVPSIVV